MEHYTVLQRSSMPLPAMIFPTAPINDNRRWNSPSLTITLPRSTDDVATISEAFWYNGWSNVTLHLAMLLFLHLSTGQDLWSINSADCIHFCIVQGFSHVSSSGWPCCNLHCTTCYPQAVQFHGFYQGCRCLVWRQRQRFDFCFLASQVLPVFYIVWWVLLHKTLWHSLINAS